MNEFAVIFDMDGVIVDTNPFHKIALRQFCQSYGYDLNDEQLLKQIYGRTNKDWISNLFDEPMTPEQLSAYGEEKEEMFREIYKYHVVPVGGFVPFLDLLEEHDVPKAIATSAPRSNVDFILGHTKTGRYFDTILDESFVSKGKPDPEIYLLTAKALGFEPAKCIVFEDSLSGVASAQAAGNKVIGVTTTHSDEELSHCDLVVSDFNGLTIEQLNALI